MPLLTSQIDNIDEARMEFIDKLNRYILALREEVRVSELVMHSVIKTLSNKTDNMRVLDEELAKLRTTHVDHLPAIKPTHEQRVLEQVEEAMRNAQRSVNHLDQLEQQHKEKEATDDDKRQ